MAPFDTAMSAHGSYWANASTSPAFIAASICADGYVSHSTLLGSLPASTICEAIWICGMEPMAAATFFPSRSSTVLMPDSGEAAPWMQPLCSESMIASSSPCSMGLNLSGVSSKQSSSSLAMRAVTSDVMSSASGSRPASLK